MQPLPMHGNCEGYKVAHEFDVYFVPLSRTKRAGKYTKLVFAETFRGDGFGSWCEGIDTIGS